MDDSVKLAFQELRRLVALPESDRNRNYFRKFGALSHVLIPKWREAASWEEETEFVEVAEWLAIGEGRATEVPALLARAIGRLDAEENSTDALLVTHQFVRSALNTNGIFRKYQEAARASPRLREAPSVRRYIL